MLKTFTALCGLLFIACCAPSAPVAAIKIENARIAVPPPGAPVAAAYFTLRNDGPADELVGASSPAAASTELHATQNENGMMKMHHMPGVAVPANGTVEFAPGGMHVMLIGPKAELTDGSQQPITLTFAHAAPITVMFTVKAP